MRHGSHQSSPARNLPPNRRSASGTWWSSGGPLLVTCPANWVIETTKQEWAGSPAALAYSQRLPAVWANCPDRNGAPVRDRELAQVVVADRPCEAGQSADCGRGGSADPAKGQADGQRKEVPLGGGVAHFAPWGVRVTCSDVPGAGHLRSGRGGSHGGTFDPLPPSRRSAAVFRFLRSVHARRFLLRRARSMP